ncbi:carbohydrate-binding protein (plasmid) [Streptomyces sp. BI20]|uniref:carbohydrate-binding protein n=1 Tax=Streptomyces sp. BI20 TaxID=3403460 RepID=UPI003C7706A5
MTDYPVNPDYETRFDKIEREAAADRARITTAEGKLTAAEGKITALQGKVSALETANNDAKAKIAALEGKALTARGDWKVSTKYTVGDLVAGKDGQYRCIKAHQSEATDKPGEGANEATYWALFTAHGKNGTDGKNGKDGTDGTNGAPDPEVRKDATWALARLTACEKELQITPPKRPTTGDDEPTSRYVTAADLEF